MTAPEPTAPLPDRDDVVATATLLAGRIVRTPLLSAPVLDARVGARILLKLENLQHTNSFKFRGALSRLLRLTPEERRRGVVAWSSGNHGRAVAAAARQLGIDATVVMPTDAPSVKRERTAREGASIVAYDRAREDREAIARAIAADTGAVVVPSYDDRWVIAGQGTAGLELLAQADADGARPEALLVCCGGGGLTAGCALALESSGIAVHTVEPEGWDDHARSLATGTRVTADGGSGLCDALLAPTPGALPWAVNRSRVRSGLIVTEAAVREAVAFAFHELRLVLEPGGAVALAAVLSGVLPAAGRTLAVLVSGGNVDPGWLAALVTAPEGDAGHQRQASAAKP